MIDSANPSRKQLEESSWRLTSFVPHFTEKMDLFEPRGRKWEIYHVKVFSKTILFLINKVFWTMGQIKLLIFFKNHIKYIK